MVKSSESAFSFAYDSVLYVLPSRRGRCLRSASNVREISAIVVSACMRLGKSKASQIIDSGEMTRTLVSVVWVQFVNTLAFEVWE